MLKIGEKASPCFQFQYLDTVLPEAAKMAIVGNVLISCPQCLGYNVFSVDAIFRVK